MRAAGGRVSSETREFCLILLLCVILLLAALGLILESQMSIGNLSLLSTLTAVHRSSGISRLGGGGGGGIVGGVKQEEQGWEESWTI